MQEQSSRRQVGWQSCKLEVERQLLLLLLLPTDTKSVHSSGSYFSNSQRLIKPAAVSPHQV
jgi:hypothetical protein